MAKLNWFTTLFLGFTLALTLFCKPSPGQQTLQVNAVWSGHVTPTGVNSNPSMSTIGTNRNRAFISFDLSLLPNGAIVSDATLHLMTTGFSTSAAVPGLEPAVSLNKDPKKLALSYGEFVTGTEYINDMQWSPSIGQEIIGTFLPAGRTALSNHAGGQFHLGIYPHNSDGFGVSLAAWNSTTFPPPSLVIVYNPGPAYKPKANFYANKTELNQGTSVQFFDDSKPGPITSYFWDFGDGNTSTSKDPVHVYDSAGNFTVKHRASNSAGTDSVVKIDYIKVNPKPKAMFRADTTRVKVGDSLMFWNESLFSPGNYEWDFAILENPDFYKSTDSNGKIAYVDTGWYSVRLIVWNNVGRDTLIREKYIQVVDSNAKEDSIPDDSTQGFLNARTVNQALYLYPNPVNRGTSVRIAYPGPYSGALGANKTIKLLDLEGRVIRIWPTETPQQDLRLDTKGLKAGMYRLIWGQAYGALLVIDH